jgi:hypothetical protein
MGVGYMLDIIVCVALGVDMFDCVYPCRTARFGTALTRKGQMRLVSQAKFRTDFRPIEEGCTCYTCKKYTRAALAGNLFKEAISSTLLTIHNITFMMTLMRDARKAILGKRFSKFVCEFLKELYPEESKTKPPRWVRNALGKGFWSDKDPEPQTKKELQNLVLEAQQAKEAAAAAKKNGEGEGAAAKKSENQNASGDAQSSAQATNAHSVIELAKHAAAENAAAEQAGAGGAGASSSSSGTNKGTNKPRTLWDRYFVPGGDIDGIEELFEWDNPDIKEGEDMPREVNRRE